MISGLNRALVNMEFSSEGLMNFLQSCVPTGTNFNKYSAKIFAPNKDISDRFRVVIISLPPG